MKVADFDFHLPDALIAQHALPRGESKLLVLDRHSGVTAHARIRDLARYLRSGDLLVANDSRVFPARLLGHRVPSGGAVECLLLAKEDQPPTSNLQPPTSQIWSALVHPGQKLKPGAIVKFAPRQGGSDARVLMAEILERQFFGRRSIRLWTEADGALRQN